jgi:hypothetical protein
LNERENTRLPAANAAEAIVSPSKPVIFQPANVNETGFDRSIRSPARGSSLTPSAPFGSRRAEPGSAVG